MRLRSLPLTSLLFAGFAFAQTAADITANSTTREVHEATIIAGSNALFGAETTPPETHEGWAALAAAAQKVIEGAQLLQSGNRPPGSSDWLMYAAEVELTTRATISGAIEARAPEEFVFLNGDMMAACTSCHQQFRNP